MFVLCLKIEILIPQATSLKHKRKTVKSLIERISSKFNVSISEVGYHDLWQRSAIGISLVNSESHMIAKVENKLMDIIYNVSELEVSNIERELIKL